MRLIGGLMGIIAFLLVVFGMTTTQTIAQDKAAVIKVTAKELLEAYKGIDKETDPKKKYKEGDDKYKGKVLEITGVMSRVIGATSPYFLIEGGTGFRARLWCAFGNEHKENLKMMRKSKQLKAGAKVTIRGTCSGMKGKDLHIDDCIMVDPQFPK